MTDDQFATAEQHHAEPQQPAPQPAMSKKLDRTEHGLAMELIEVLALHPKGLRRWSVMRAIRHNRDRASKDVPPKMEADIERVFRRYCAGDEARKCRADDALFFRPGETAGEVWAAYPDRVKAWLES